MIEKMDESTSATTVAVVTPPAVTLDPQLAESARKHLAQVAQLEVKTPAQYLGAADLLKAVKAKWDEIEAQRVKVKKPFDEAVKGLQAFFRNPLTTLKSAEELLKQKLRAYDDEQLRIQRELNAKLEREATEARRKAEAQAQEARRKAEAQAAEVRRKAEAEAAEIRRKAEAEAAEVRRKAEEAAAAGRPEDARRLKTLADQGQRVAEQRVLAEQAKAETKADTLVQRADGRAQGYEERAASVVAPIAQVATPKVAGLSRRTEWHYKVTDLAAVKREFLTLDDDKIGRIVKAMHKDAEALVGGIEVYDESALASRSR